MAKLKRNILLTLTLEEVEGLYDTLDAIGHQYRFLRAVQRALLDQIATILQNHPESTVINPRDLAWLQALPVSEEEESHD